MTMDVAYKCRTHKPLRRGDEYYCPECGVAWGVDEDPPTIGCVHDPKSHTGSTSTTKRNSVSRHRYSKSRAEQFTLRN